MSVSLTQTVAHLQQLLQEVNQQLTKEKWSSVGYGHQARCFLVNNTAGRSADTWPTHCAVICLSLRRRFPLTVSRWQLWPFSFCSFVHTCEVVWFRGKEPQCGDYRRGSVFVTGLVCDYRRGSVVVAGLVCGSDARSCLLVYRKRTTVWWRQERQRVCDRVGLWLQERQRGCGRVGLWWWCPQLPVGWLLCCVRVSVHDIPFSPWLWLLLILLYQSWTENEAILTL